MTGQPILEVEKLNIRFNTPVGEVHAVRDVSFTMGREKLAIVGESGSGKSQTGARHPWPHARQGDGGQAGVPRPEPARPLRRSSGAKFAASASPW